LSEARRERNIRPRGNTSGMGALLAASPPPTAFAPEGSTRSTTAMKTAPLHHRIARPLAAAALLAAFAAPARAQGTPRDGQAINDATLDISPVGDVTEKVRYRVTQSDWNRLEQSGLGANYFKRHLGSYRANWIEAPGSYTFERKEGTTLAFEMSIVELGAAQNLGDGDWEFEVAPTASFFNFATENGRVVATFSHEGSILPAAGCISAATLTSGLGRYTGKLLVVLPTGASDPEWNEAGRVVRYRMPPATGTGPGRIRGTLETRDRILPTAYKVYGIGTSRPGFSDQWVARTTFQNQSGNVVKNVEVRYRTSDLDQQAMGSQRFAEIAPGQTAVSVFYPVFARTIADNTSGKMTNVVVEWSYTDAEGKQHSSNETKRIEVKAHREFVFSDIKAGAQHDTMFDVFSNAPLLAAWVSENDTPVLEVSNSAIAFMRRTRSNPGDLDVLEWLYNTMLVFDLVYKKPAGRTEASPHTFDPVHLQTVYLPRDVIEGNAGTCIDLAIFYAAMAKCQGLDPYLMLIPGHCFPVIKLKDMGYVGVETTMVMGGWLGGSGSWAQALQEGQKQFAEWSNKPNALLLDLKTLWGSGVHTPELPPYPTDGLVARRKDRDSLWERLRGIQNEPARTGGSQSRETRALDTLANNLEGGWTGVGAAGGRDYTLAATITRTDRTLVLQLTASLDNAQVIEEYEGALGAGVTTLALKTRTVVDLATKQSKEDRTTRAEIIVRQESVTTIVIERVRRDRVEKRETFRLNRQ
jgi:hypothetical protein